MSLEITINYLLSDDTPVTPERIESAQLLLGEGGPPQHVRASTLAAMSDEINSYHQDSPVELFSGKKSRHRLWVGGVIAMAAAVLLQVETEEVESSPHSVNTESMTPKGNEAAAPEVSLELAIMSRGGQVERFSSEQTYGLGDSVFFRAGINSSAEVALFHIESGVVTTLLETTLEEGETDLAVENSPARWMFESGDEDATFMLVSLPNGASAEGVTQTLTAVLEDGGGDLCESLRMIGCQCDQRAVMVSTE